MTDALRVVAADGDRWEDVRGLFGRAGAENGCWCQYWLLGAEYHRRPRARERNEADLHAQADAQRAGLLAVRGDRPVGWARLTPRSDLAHLTDRFGGFAFSADDPLSLACFFVGRSARGTGVMSALIAGALAEGRRRRMPVEAYPIDPAVPGATRNRFPGVLPAFLAAGFTEIGRLAGDRAVVRSP